MAGCFPAARPNLMEKWCGADWFRQRRLISTCRRGRDIAPGRLRSHEDVGGKAVVRERVASPALHCLIPWSLTTPTRSRLSLLSKGGSGHRACRFGVPPTGRPQRFAEVSPWARSRPPAADGHGVPAGVRAMYGPLKGCPAHPLRPCPYGSRTTGRTSRAVRPSTPEKTRPLPGNEMKEASQACGAELRKPR